MSKKADKRQANLKQRVIDSQQGLKFFERHAPHVRIDLRGIFDWAQRRTR